MKVGFFDTHRYEEAFFEAENKRTGSGFDITYLAPRLNADTADLGAGFDAVCVFVNDRVDAETVDKLAAGGVRCIVLRCAGFNNVDLNAAFKAGIPVARVPEYSPYAVAEHALALLMTLNRKIHRSYNRVRELNFSLEGLVGFDIHGKTVGVIGTGKIGKRFAAIMHGMGCRIAAYDPYPDHAWAAETGAEYVALDELYAGADIISLHCPLTEHTRHIVDQRAFALMKDGAYLLNTGRGALIETTALIAALKTGKIGAAGLDVYEEEAGVFFYDLSDKVLQDDVLARLLTFPNVLITSHQGFLTGDALKEIARVTLGNLYSFRAGENPPTLVEPPV